jgi:hypothetical protein
MALTLIPSDLVEQAARDENWTDSDRRHCSRMLHQAFEESFQVRDSANPGRPERLRRAVRQL